MKRTAIATVIVLVATAGWWLTPRLGVQINLDVVWIREFREPGAVLAAPAVDDARLFVSVVSDRGLLRRGAVHALDRTTGSIIWTFDDEGTMARSTCTPRLAGRRVYVGEGLHESQRAKLYSLDSESGRKIWEFAADGHIEGGALVGNGYVVFGAGDAGAYSLHMDGRLRWRFADPVHIDTAPVTNCDNVIVSSGVSRRSALPGIFALSAVTGEKLWQVRTELPAWGGPVVADGVVVCGLGHNKLDSDRSPGGAVLALDIASGRERWHTPMRAAVVAIPVVHAGYVFAADMKGDVTAFDLRTGRIKWVHSLTEPIVAGLALFGDTLIVADKAGRVVGLGNSDGRFRWEFDIAKRAQLPVQVTATPVVASDGVGRTVLYLGCEVDPNEGKSAVIFAVRLP